MSNGARHAWGILVGVVLTAALGALLIYGTSRLQHGYLIQLHKNDKWIGGGLLAGAAVVFGLMTASRLSPVGSLIGGLVLTAAGVVFFVSQKTTADLINRFPIKGQRATLTSLEGQGILLVIGVALLFATFFPSRWRSQYEDEEEYDYDGTNPSTSYTQPMSGGRHASPTARQSGGPLYEQAAQPPQHPYASGRTPYSEEGGTR
jgi:hypothetical protein